MPTVREMERTIVCAIVEDALDRGFTVQHHDGEAFTARAQLTSDTTKEAQTRKIMDEIRVADEENLVFSKDGRKVGYVFLVYGNDGHDVICDNTATKEVESILARANELAQKYSEGAYA